MLARRRSANEKPVFGMKTDPANKGNGEAEWRERHGWRTLGQRTYKVIRWLHPKRLMMLLASATEHVKRIAMVVIHGRSCRRTRLLTWFSDQLRRGGGCAAAQWASLEPCDLRAVWREGALLCALVDALVPGSCPEHPDNNIAIAQEAVSKQWALPPAFTDDELLQVTFSSHFERRLLRYLAAIQQASERLPGASDIPTLGSDADADAGARVNGPYASSSRASPACVARGMGLFTATQYRRASFLLYLLDADPSDVFVVIQTERDFGFARVGHHGCVLPSRYSNIPIMISRDSGNGTRVTFTPQSWGPHELVILRKGVHIPGSPFCIPVEKTTKVGSVEKEDWHTPVRRKRLRVLLRTVDFVTEKMILTDDGKLKKIPASFLDEHLTALKEGKNRRKPEIYIYVSEEGSTMHQVWGSSPGCSDVDSEQEGESKVTKNSPARKLTDSSHIPRHDGVGRGKCLQRQRNLDSTCKKVTEFQGNTRVAKSTEFQSRCKKIITMCKFVLEKSRKSRGLSLLNAFHKIIDGRPIRMTDEIELMLKRLAQSLPPPALLEPIADLDKLETTETEEMPSSDLDHRLSPSPPGGYAGNACDVAVHTQIKCFEDKLAYCNNYIESVLQQNTAHPECPASDLQDTTELMAPQRSKNPAVKTDFKIEPRDVRVGEPTPHGPSPSPSPITDPFNSNKVLDYVAAEPKLDSVKPTDSLKIKTTIPAVESESGDHNPRSISNPDGFRPASSSSPSSMSEASTEGAAAIFPDLDAFLSCQFTKYMTSETQFHLWPSDVAFGDVQDTICAMEDDEMIDFDSVISAPNLEDALVKLEQGLRMKSTARRESELNSKDEAMAACSGDGERNTTCEIVEKVVSNDVGKPSTNINKTEPVENADSKLDVCQAEYLEKDCDQNRSPDNFEFVVNPPAQEADPGEDGEPDAEEADDVGSNPSPQAGQPSVEGWDSAYLSIDDLKGSPENRLASSLAASNHSVGNDSREKQACWSQQHGDNNMNSNMALAGFMGPAEKEIWGYEEEQDDYVDQLSGASFYPRVLTPLTKMMSLIMEEDEEKIVACSNVEKGDITVKSFSPMQQGNTNSIEVSNFELQNKEAVTGMRNTNDLENLETRLSDLDRDCNGNPSAKLCVNVQTLIDQSPADAASENTDSKLDSNLDGVQLDDLDCDLDCDIDQSLDDTLDEDVSVAFDALIAEQLDLFDQGSDFDSALAEALQVSALREKTASPMKNSVESFLQEEETELQTQKQSTNFQVLKEGTELQVEEGSTELKVLEEITELKVQGESIELLVQEKRSEFPEQEESVEWQAHGESPELQILDENTKLPVQKESGELPIQGENTELPMLEQSVVLPVQEHRDAMCIDWTVQSAGTEIPSLECYCEQPVLTDSTVSCRHKGDKLVTTNIRSLQNEEGEKVQKESDDCSFIFIRDDACLPDPKLAVDVEATSSGATTIEVKGFSEATITKKECASDYSSKSCKNLKYDNTAITVEQIEIQSAVLPGDIEEIANKFKQEIKEGSIDGLIDESTNDKRIAKVNILTSVSPPIAKIGECLPTKANVTFKKDYWDRKVQMLDLVGKHSQPRSIETCQESRKTPKDATDNQSDSCSLPLSTVTSIKPHSTTKSKTEVKNCETLPRSPSLYRARRVLVSEDSDDGPFSEGQTKKYSKRHQSDVEGLTRKHDSERDLTPFEEIEVLKTERPLKGTRQCKDGDLSILEEYPRRRSTLSSEREVMPKASSREKSRSHKGTEDVGRDSRQDDNVIDFGNAASLRRDSPQKMKERFQSAKQFFQSLEKSSGHLSRGMSSESDGGSLWESKGAGWRGPFGGSERVRVPRRCHIKELF